MLASTSRRIAIKWLKRSHIQHSIIPRTAVFPSTPFYLVRSFVTNPDPKTAEITDHSKSSSNAIISDSSIPKSTMAEQGILSAIDQYQVFGDVGAIISLVSKAHAENLLTHEVYKRILIAISESSLQIKESVIIARWFYDEDRKLFPEDMLNDPRTWVVALKAGLRLSSTYRDDVTRLMIKKFKSRFDLSTMNCQDAWEILIRIEGIFGGKHEIDSFLKIITSSESLSTSMNVPSIKGSAAMAYASCGESEAAESLLKEIDQDQGIPEFVLQKFISIYGFAGDIERTKKYVQMMNERYPKAEGERDTLTVLMMAHKSALQHLVTNVTKQIGVQGLSLGREIPQMGTIGSSWSALQDQIKQENKTLNLSQCNIALEYITLANRIQPNKFPMSLATEIVEDYMPRHEIAPNKITFMILINGFARTQEFTDPKAKGRLDKALEQLQKMRSYGIQVKEAAYFHSLFRACLPRVRNKFPFDYFKLASNMAYRVEPHDVHVDNRIFDIERIMLNARIPHDRHTFKTLLTCFGVSGQYKAMWNRWKALKQVGIKIDRGMYQRIFALCSLNESQAQYAMTVTRQELHREFISRKHTLDLYAAMLDCCIAAQDSQAASEILSEMRNRRTNLPLNVRLYETMLQACVSITGLEDQVPRLLDDLRLYDIQHSPSIWKSKISYLAIHEGDPQKIQQSFSDYTMHRFISDGKIPILVRESSPAIPFPSGPYSQTDCQIIDIYISTLLDSQDLSLVMDALQVLREQSTQIGLSKRTLKGIVKLAVNEEANKELNWLITDVLPHVSQQGPKYTSWLKYLEAKYSQK